MNLFSLWNLGNFFLFVFLPSSNLSLLYQTATLTLTIKWGFSSASGAVPSNRCFRVCERRDGVWRAAQSSVPHLPKPTASPFFFSSFLFPFFPFPPFFPSFPFFPFFLFFSLFLACFLLASWETGSQRLWLFLSLLQICKSETVDRQKGHFTDLTNNQNMWWGGADAGSVAAQAACVSLKSPCVSAFNEEALAPLMALSCVVSAVL